jgi:sterol desaturase/sphingolipid hydroxylase (fatty acid hydroxylase superfamily)
LNSFILDNEIVIRLFFFLGVFTIMGVCEYIAPRRSLSSSKRRRWGANLGITLLNSLVLRTLFPIAAVGMAAISNQRGWGIFNLLGMSSLLSGIISLILLDLTIYCQHVLFHKTALCWRLHKMHHTDLDIDVTTGSRFHPLEIILSMGIKIVVVVLLGAPAWSVLTFEILLNATSMFNHSNVRIPTITDKMLRSLIVTPDMHRVHHSVVMHEMNSNFGFNFSLWDRLFKTYRPQPEKGHEAMTIGLNNYRDKKYLTLPWMLALPFLGGNRE